MENNNDNIYTLLQALCKNSEKNSNNDTSSSSFNTQNNNNYKASTPVIDPSAGFYTNCCKNVYLDMPLGFQYINPTHLSIIGELIGIIIAKRLPINLATAYAAFLNQVGQIIETYGSQQIYLQSGPGRFYDLGYANVTNPFCTCNTSSQNNTSNNITRAELDAVIDTIDALDKKYNSELELIKTLLINLSSKKN